jgi:predicted small secreted protein
MEMQTRRIAALLALITVLALAACVNTIKGGEHDLHDAGEAVHDVVTGQ